jgi:hypothetical protein
MVHLVKVNEPIDVAIDSDDVIFEKACPPLRRVAAGRLPLFAKRRLLHVGRRLGFVPCPFDGDIGFTSNGRARSASPHRWADA